MTREIEIVSGIIVEPGDRVLLALPAHATAMEAAELHERVKAWAPGVDWLLVAGPEVIVQRLHETDARPDPEGGTA